MEGDAILQTRSFLFPLTTIPGRQCLCLHSPQIDNPAEKEMTYETLAPCGNSDCIDRIRSAGSTTGGSELCRFLPVASA